MPDRWALRFSGFAGRGGMIVVLAVLAMSVIAGTASGQRWSIQYNRSVDDRTGAMVNTADGKFVLAGRIREEGTNRISGYLAKLDMDGSVLWEYKYGSPDFGGSFRAIARTRDHGFVMAGWIQGAGAGSCDFWVVRVDADGNLLWQNAYGGPEWEEANAVVQEIVGGEPRVVVVGRTWSFGAGRWDMWMLALDDADGSVLVDPQRGPLQFAHGWEGEENAHDILVLDPDPVTGAMVVVGETDSDLWSAGGLDFWVLFISHHLVALREYTYGGRRDDRCFAVGRAGEGIIVVGEEDSFLRDRANMWALRIDEFGQILWQQSYHRSQQERATCVTQLSSGRIVIGGWSNSTPGYSCDYVLLNVNPLTGEIDTGYGGWQKWYDLQEDFCEDPRTVLEAMVDGDLVVSGVAQAPPAAADKADWWALNLDPADGNVKVNPAGPDKICHFEASNLLVHPTTEQSTPVLAVSQQTFVTALATEAMREVPDPAIDPDVKQCPGP